MIVASFYAPRPEHPRWRDYLPSLRLLQASCDWHGLPHVVLTDADLSDVLPEMETFRTDLPADLNKAVLKAQRDFLALLELQDVLLVGADCAIVEDPTPPLADGVAMAVTTGPRFDSKLNTGAMWVAAHARKPAADLWTRALARVGHEWGDDQMALQAELAPLTLETGVFQRGGMTVRVLSCDPWNLKPNHVAEDCRPKIAHFTGDKKAWAAEWYYRFGRPA